MLQLSTTEETTALEHERTREHPCSTHGEASSHTLLPSDMSRSTQAERRRCGKRHPTPHRSRDLLGLWPPDLSTKQDSTTKYEIHHENHYGRADRMGPEATWITDLKGSQRQQLGKTSGAIVGKQASLRLGRPYLPRRSIVLAYKKMWHSIPAIRVSKGHTLISSIFVSNRSITESGMHRH